VAAASAEPIYRAPMRARDRDCPAGAGARHGLEHGLVGTGDRLSSVPPSLEAAITAAIAAHGEKAGRMLRHFADLPDGTLVWTRVADGEYVLGRIAGPWFYDDSAAAREVGIHHVRRARWLEHPFGEDEVPVAVAETFARGGRNLQRVRSEHAERATAKLWARGGLPAAVPD
jgi:hypothetical protein